MKLNIERKFVDLPDFYHSVYHEKNISFCCEGNKFMYDNGLLSFVDGNTEDNIFDFKENSNPNKNVFVGLQQNSMEDYGDYNYDDEYEPYYVEVSSYFKINNCPMCGKQIEIEIKENDISKEYEAIKMKYPKGKKTKADKELRKKLDEDFENLLY